MQDLPRLLYVGDVPVEASYHGSALLHRLLASYPAASLRIVEPSLGVSRPDRRVAGVEYRVLNVGSRRWLDTRLHGLVSRFYTLRAASRAANIEGILDGFEPQAVLTVAHGYAWMAAARFAGRRGLPLHVIVHDDWPSVAPQGRVVGSWLDRQFSAVYGQATSRLCVSPFMVEEYKRRYGYPGTLLYPSRDPRTPVFDPLRDNENRSDRAFAVAYAGSLATTDYVRQLVLLSKLLADLGGRLLLYGPFDKAMLVSAGMEMSSVTAGGLLPSADLVRVLHENADLLFLPMSFVTSDSSPAALAFPSKLTDYTAAGVPLLIWGPEESAAVKWAAGEPGVAAVVTDPDPGEMALMLRKLMDSPAWRKELAVRASQVGGRLFSSDAATEIFYSCLRNGRRILGASERIL